MSSKRKDRGSKPAKGSFIKKQKPITAGEIARAAAVFEVDEIIVFEDFTGASHAKRFDPNAFLARILQYVETPHLRLLSAVCYRSAGLLNPLDAPHHMRASDWCRWREGVVVDRPTRQESGSYVNIGLQKEAYIDATLPAGIRVTVDVGDKPKQIKPGFSSGGGDDDDDSGAAQPAGRCYRGKAVSPAEPRERAGFYWGYTVRIAESIGNIFTESPFDGGYDLTIGTSERGTSSVCDPEFSLKPFRHMLLVLGGVAGLEEAVQSDEQLGVSGDQTGSLFDKWVNICPSQGSRTIRTEEALPIALASMQRFIRANLVPK